MDSFKLITLRHGSWYKYYKLNKLKILFPDGDPKCMDEMRRNYLLISKKVRSVIPFVKVAYPEMTFAYNAKNKENLAPSADRFTLRCLFT